MDGFTTTTFEPEAQDSFGQYAIQPGSIHVFPFQIPMFGAMEIGHAHILPSTQDFSIDGWVSDAPLDGRRYGHFKLMRRRTEIVYHCSFMKTDVEDPRYFLESGKTFYVNIKNLANQRNAYELTFSPTTAQ